MRQIMVVLSRDGHPACRIVCAHYSGEHPRTPYNLVKQLQVLGSIKALTHSSSEKILLLVGEVNFHSLRVFGEFIRALQKHEIEVLAYKVNAKF